MSRRVRAAILFADICDSTGIFDHLGDRAARDLTSEILSLMARITKTRDGEVVKTIGDAILSAFPHPVTAIEAACEMNRKMLDFDVGKGLLKPQIRSGLHMGTVLREGGDVFGDVVNVAAKLMDFARPGDILVDRTAIKPLLDELPYEVKAYITLKIKGREAPVHTALIMWDMGRSDLTEFRTRDTNLSSSLGGQLILEDSHKRRWELSAEGKTVFVGRGAENTIVISHPRISRRHAAFLKSGRRFLIRDVSRNGTFVHPEGIPPQRLFRSEMELAGRGQVSFGEEKLDSDTPFLWYELVG